MEYLKIYLWPFLASQVASFLLLWAAYAAPRFARVLFFFLFAGACYVNLTTAVNTPLVYLDYAPMAITPYADFINGWFKDHITAMVCTIAVCQGLIAIAMLMKGGWVRLACAGGIIFLLGIAPLGVGAAFPFSLTVSLALYFILRRDPHPGYLWNVRNRKAYENRY